MRLWVCWLSSFPQENHQRVILEEKRRKREEAKRLADAKKKERGAGKKVGPVVVEPEEGTCVIDNLLKEIRSGTTLRKTNRKSIHHGPKLGAQELEKLKRIASQVSSSQLRRVQPYSSP